MNKNICNIDGCERPYWAKNKCIYHYKKEWAHPLYQVWDAMKQRCNNPNNKKYYLYGARGINVCERWLIFDNFLTDMGEKPTPKHSIDRIDVNGGYSPENCRWATGREQNLNRRLDSRNTSGYVGVSLDKRRGTWTVRMKVNDKYKFFGEFSDKKDAIERRKDIEKTYGTI